VIHRDLKPENILLHEGEAMLADFGIALAVKEAGGNRLTETGLSLGTPQYMSPEQATGDRHLDARSDVYSLGVVLYEMLAGEPPYTGITAHAIMAKRLREPVPHLGSIRQVPRAFEVAIEKALASAPADRFRTVAQFADALGNATWSAAETTVESPSRRAIMWMSAAALALFAVWAGWKGVKARSESATRMGVALLPCESTSPREEGAYIGDRWSEELIRKLVRVGGLNPKSWLSVRRYRDTRLSMHQVGTELNAGMLVRCQVSEQSTGVRLNAELIRARDERVTWSNAYEQPAGAEGINAAQSAAARDIAGALGASLPQVVVASVERPLSHDSTALRAYRVGKHFLESHEEPSAVRSSMGYFEQAIEKDSSFAQAYVGLAEAMIWRTEHESRVSREYYPTVAQLLRAAIALDPSIAEAHTFLARYLLEYTHDWAGAEDENRRALSLDPSSLDAHGWYGWYLQTAGRFDEAIREFDEAVQLDPANWLARAQLVRALTFAGKEGRALRELREAFELWPESEVFYHHWAVLLLRQGQRDSARTIVEGHIHTATWYNGWLAAAAGRPDWGQRILDSLLALNATRPVDPALIAALEAGLGNRAQALTWLERAYAERSQLLLFLLGPHPAFDGMRKDPRFLALRQKAGFKN
jgi:serine/threonine-protein kinase